MAKKLSKKKSKIKIKTKNKKRLSKKNSVSTKFMDMEQIYKTINQAQVTRKNQQLIVDLVDSPMVENILKDLQMTFTKQQKYDYSTYKIDPPPVAKVDEEIFTFDEMDDEIQDKEQCF